MKLFHKGDEAFYSKEVYDLHREIAKGKNGTALEKLLN